MPYEVRLTHNAERDLDDIYSYIAQHHSPDRADRVLVQLLKIAEDIAAFPESGSCPSELADIGIREFRQVILAPYRLIYRVQAPHITVHLIADGRRDMQSLLAQRLLTG